MYDHDRRKPYQTDLMDAQWELLAPFIPEVSPDATRETIPRREIESADSLRVADRVCMETLAPRFACLADRLSFFPPVENGWHLGDGDEPLTQASASSGQPRRRTECG